MQSAKKQIYLHTKPTNQTMKRTILAAAIICCTSIHTPAQTFFDNHFADATLRIDYTLSGNNKQQDIHLDQMTQSNGWYGRRANLKHLPLKGNGQITITDTLGTDTLYRHSFSTLFQEWTGTEEASRIIRSFEASFCLPMPKHKVQVTVDLYDAHQTLKSRFNHIIDPADILIRKHSEKNTQPWEYLKKSGDSRKKIDVVFVPEGYTKNQMKTFRKDCMQSIEVLMRHAPFSEMKDRFNFILVNSPSKESGVSIPHNGHWVNTLLGSHFDTFYSDRYLTTLNIKRLYDTLNGIPCESIIILANTDNYGGGGIYNNYLLSAAHNEKSLPVVVHEFGHSFAALADEYFYDDQYEPMYPAGIEPWEQNITTLTDFDKKWKDMLPEGTAIPTEADGNDIYTKVGVYEGAGYQSKGCYRPTQECRMKINEAPEFCPVCQRAIRRIIEYLTE